MKGQKLLVRPLEPADHQAVRRFLDRHSPQTDVPAWGLIGKVVGEVVALAVLEIQQRALRIDHLIVAKELRRKRIGRQMLIEAERIAASMDLGRIVVTGRAGAEQFLTRTGFTREGDQWFRTINGEDLEAHSR